MFIPKHAQQLVTKMPQQFDATHRFKKLPNAPLQTIDLFKKQTTAIDSLSALIAPIDPLGRWESSQAVEVQDFTERGLTFQHTNPLRERRAVVVLESVDLGRVTAEVDLTWCRFTRSGKYLSGGRFVRRANRSA